MNLSKTASLPRTKLKIIGNVIWRILWVFSYLRPWSCVYFVINRWRLIIDKQRNKIILLLKCSNLLEVYATNENGNYDISI